jgi:hypothetical protein
MDKHENVLVFSVACTSLVFLIPLIIIVIGGMWEPFDGDSSAGIRWAIVSFIALLVCNAGMVAGKLYRGKH